MDTTRFETRCTNGTCERPETAARRLPRHRARGRRAVASTEAEPQRGGRLRRPSLCDRSDAGIPAAPGGQGLPLCHPTGFHHARQGPRAYPLAGDPSRVARRLDLSRRARPSAGHGSRRAREEAAPLSPALARGQGRSEVRPHPGVRRGSAGLRKRAAADLAGPTLSRRKVVAAVVQLLEKTLIRVGNDEYARDNESFGLTTLRDGHARITGSTIRFRFKGKSGKFHDIALNDARLARDRPPMSGAAGPRAVSISRRGRRGAGHRLGRRQRLPARRHGPRLHGQGLPHLDWNRPGRQGASRDEVFHVERRRPSATCWPRSRRWRRCWATPDRSAGSATSIRRSSTPTWIARWPRR